MKSDNQNHVVSLNCIYNKMQGVSMSTKTASPATDQTNPFRGAIEFAGLLTAPPVWDEKNLDKLTGFEDEYLETMRKEYDSDPDIDEILVNLKKIGSQEDWFDWIDGFESSLPAMDLDALCALRPTIRDLRDALMYNDLSPLELLISELEEAVGNEVES